ncbi:MAG: restriction endonuclease subunit S [Desulforhopalus sp.]
MDRTSAWQQIRLGEICEINPRLPSDLDTSNTTKVTFLPMAAVDEVFGEILRAEERTYEEVKKGFTPFIENDVLFAKITPSMENGKATIARSLINGVGFGSTEFHVLRCSEQVLPEYLFYFIRQPSFRMWAKDSFTGSAGQQRVPADFLARVFLPLPTLLEQQRIVDIIKQGDELRRARRDVLDKTKQLPQALFFEMFGDPEPRINDRWKFQRIGDLTMVETGGTPSRSKTEYYTGRIPWVKSTELMDKVINSSEERINEDAVRESNTKIFPEDTILLAMYGQGQTRGRTAKLAIPAACNQAIAAILPSQELVPDYIFVWLQCSYEAVRSLGRGGQQANLNLSIVRNLKIPKPPKEVQLHFSRIYIEIQQQLASITVSLKEQEHVFDQILIEAFSGSLTQTWRDANYYSLKDKVQEKRKIIRPPKQKDRVTGATSDERPWLGRKYRGWLLDQLSEFQGFVYSALQKWKGTLIPSDALDEFIERCFQIEHLEDANDQIKRALNQLAGLGLIAQVSIPNQEGEYVTGYRGLREDELSQVSDRHLLARG